MEGRKLVSIAALIWLMLAIPATADRRSTPEDQAAHQAAAMLSAVAELSGREDLSNDATIKKINAPQKTWERVTIWNTAEQNLSNKEWIAITSRLHLFEEVAGVFPNGWNAAILAAERLPHKLGNLYADDEFYLIVRGGHAGYQVQSAERAFLATFSNLEALEKVGVQFAVEHKAARVKREREGGPSAEESRGQGLTEEELARRNTPVPASRSLWGTWRITLLAVVGLGSLCGLIAWLVRRSGSVER